MIEIFSERRRVAVVGFSQQEEGFRSSWMWLYRRTKDKDGEPVLSVVIQEGVELLLYHSSL